MNFSPLNLEPPPEGTAAEIAKHHVGDARDVVLELRRF
jgi:hypothetical protein